MTWKADGNGAEGGERDRREKAIYSSSASKRFERHDPIYFDIMRSIQDEQVDSGREIYASRHVAPAPRSLQLKRHRHYK